MSFDFFFFSLPGTEENQDKKPRLDDAHIWGSWESVNNRGYSLGAETLSTSLWAQDFMASTPKIAYCGTFQLFLKRKLSGDVPEPSSPAETLGSPQ